MGNKASTIQHVTILGAGISGLVAALELARVKLNVPIKITILEKDNKPGGLLTSSYKNGIYWDNGLYKFTADNEAVKMFPDLFELMCSHMQQVIINNRIIRYPPQPQEFINSKSLWKLFKTAIDILYFSSQKLLKSDKANLYNWLKNRMTENIVNKTKLTNYFIKLQGLSATELSVILAYHRLLHIENNSNVLKLMKKFLNRKSHVLPQPLMVARPEKKGISGISSELAERCSYRGVNIHYNTCVKRIKSNNNNTYEIFYSKGQKQSTMKTNNIISTLPITELVNLMPNSYDLKTNRINYMDMILIFYLIKIPKIKTDHYVLYSFDINHQWKRLVARKYDNQHTSVIVEITNKNPNIDINQLEELVTSDLSGELKLFKVDDILLTYHTYIKNAYPIYENGFYEQTEKILNRFNSNSFQMTGRQSLFYYCSTNDAIKKAKEAANKIMDSLERHCLNNKPQT